MKEDISYPICLFEEPLLIPQRKEDARILLEKVDVFMNKRISQRKIRTNTFNLTLEYFQVAHKHQLSISLRFCIPAKDQVIVEFIFEDKESEFVIALRKYNQIFEQEGFSIFRSLYKEVFKKNRVHISKQRYSVEDRVIIMLHSVFYRNHRFKEETTKEGSYKITYQIA